jgi:hypothetical protein
MTDGGELTIEIIRPKSVMDLGNKKFVIALKACTSPDQADILL